MLRKCLLFTLVFALSATPVWAQSKDKKAKSIKFNPQADPLKKGDQADVEISRGFFIDSEVGLLTFLAGEGALVYRPGMLVALRFGQDIRKDLTFYGKIGGTVTGNTACFGDPRGTACQDVKDKFGFPPKIKGRPLPRQGVSMILGAGLRWAFLTIDERFFFHLTVELLGQMIPPDNVPEADADKVTDTTRKNLAFGGGAGAGFGVEYYFVLKHFSASVNIRAYYFATPFMENSLLGLATIVSAGLKYTF
ncbi:MAG TPA: hypothetical protein DCE42_01305 [Myxococcales bacterium]|nr:hypothetical protein [Deltaproteobacteria bacterium]HAA53359.1 hypothetical protein [Myxococcales bacterium]